MLVLVPKKRVICVSFRGQLLISFNEWLTFQKREKRKENVRNMI